MRLVIVGGVAGGMSAAARARRLDESAEIIILERGPEVSFANCGLPYFVGGEITDPEKLLVQTPEKLKAALNLDVRVNHDVIGLDLAGKTLTVANEAGRHQLSYDALVLAPGAVALRPPLPGLESPRVHTLRTVSDAHKLRDLATGSAKRAVVLGAGFIGLEAAEALKLQGLDVSVVELSPHVLPPLDAELAALATQELHRLGIAVFAGVAATEIIAGDSFDTVKLGDGTKLAADLIVLSVGVRPDTAQFEKAGIECERGAILINDHGQTNDSSVWAVGDAVLSRDAVTSARRIIALAGPANRAGRLVADHIFNPKTARKLPDLFGTAIVRLGAQTIAMTGANKASLLSAGIEHHSIHVHPNQHAGYFPGATQIHLVVHFAKTDGKILGAQAVGLEGVDKRIDVLATAMRGGLKIGDLMDLDLNYSPPYGQAKDAVVMVGMKGENVLNGTIRLWYATDLAEIQASSLVLDVRTRAEYATEYLPGSLNIPHTELRERLDEVRQVAAGRPVRILCESGVRSYLAHRILDHAGFDSATMSGGMLTLRATYADQLDQVLVLPNA